MVMEPQTRQPADKSIEYLAGIDFVPRIKPLLFPAIDDIKPVVQLPEKGWDFGGVILEIGIHHQNQIASCSPHARRESCGFPEIPTKADSPDLGMCRREILNDLPRPVR